MQKALLIKINPVQKPVGTINTHNKWMKIIMFVKNKEESFSAETVQPRPIYIILCRYKSNFISGSKNEQKNCQSLSWNYDFCKYFNKHQNSVLDCTLPCYEKCTQQCTLGSMCTFI